MIANETIAIFLGASFLLALSPGPDNLFVLMQSALYGCKSGLAVSLGLCTGLVVHTAGVAWGVAAILKTSPTAFTLLKVLGVLYLIYLAIQAFRAGAIKHLAAKNIHKPTLAWLYLRGIVMNITNPKVSIFFIAFFPQFVDPVRGQVSVQIMLLGGLFMLTTICVFSAVAYFAANIGEWLKKSERVQSYLNKLAGCIFVSLAIHLAVSET